MKTKTDMDDVLRGWGARRAPAADRLQALEARIIRSQQLRTSGARTAAEAASRLPAKAGTPTESAGKAPAILRTAVGFAAGVAATLATLLMWQVFACHRDGLAPLLREESGLFDGRRRSLARVFGETERVFGPSLMWVAQTGRDAELGLDERPGPTGNGSPLVMHLSVVARRDGDACGWRRVWQSDVVARTDGVMEMAPDGDPANRLTLWMHRLEGRDVLIESRLSLHTPLRMRTETSEILRFGATRDVSRVRCGDTEYRLLQTVAPAKGGDGCSS
jgi:hypothetical protein